MEQIKKNTIKRKKRDKKRRKEGQIEWGGKWWRGERDWIMEKKQWMEERKLRKVTERKREREWEKEKEKYNNKKADDWEG